MNAPERPLWSRGLTAALGTIRAGERARDAALGQRCEAEESGGVRCTADAEPEHVHRYRIEDLPPPMADSGIQKDNS